MLNPVLVFHQIAQAGHPGRIDFESGLTKHQFYISGGLLLYASSTDPYFALDAYLARKQSFGKSDQKLLRARAQEDTRPLEALIDSLKLLSQEEIFGAVATLCREIAYDLFSWTEGDYSFVANQSPPQGALRVDLDLATLLDRGQQVNEKWKALTGKVPKLEVVLHRTGQPPQASEVEISPEEWQILATVDDARNVYEICSELSPNRLQILSRIARLIEKNLLEIADFKERAKPGSLGGKSLKFSTIATTLQNLFSIFFERSASMSEAEVARKLNLSMQEVTSKGYPLPTGIAFDPQSVFRAQSLLQSFCFTGQVGDLKSILRSLTLILQQLLSELRETAPSAFEATVTDMRGVLAIAEELLPEFHLSIQTTIEKALQGEALPSAAKQETPASAPHKHTPSPAEEPRRIEAPAFQARTAEFSEQMTAEIKSVPAKQLEAITNAAATKAATQPSKPRHEEPPPTASPPPKRQGTQRHESIAPKSPIKPVQPESDEPEFEPTTETRVAPRQQEQDEADGGQRRKVLVGVLVFLVLALFTIIAVGGYLLSTNKKLLKRVQQALHKLELVESQRPHQAPGSRNIGSGEVVGCDENGLV